jgi:hypothetical protein
MQLSRDTSAAGDRVASESYLQHAEHYYRMLRAMQPQQMPILDQRQDFDYEDDGEGEDGDGEGDGAEAEGGGEQPYAQREQRPQGERQGGGERGPRQAYRDPQGGGYTGPRPDAPPRQEGPRPEGQMSEEGAPQGADAEGLRNNRRRRNRGRYRPEGGDERGPRGPEGGGDQAGPVEGFGEAAPAFVTGE